MENYTKKYAEYFGIEWDSSKYEIHHIDGNRENNAIENLILLPKEMHNKLHKQKERISKPFDFAEYERKVLNGIPELESGYTKEYLQFCSRLSYWGYIKNIRYRQCNGELMDIDKLDEAQNGWW